MFDTAQISSGSCWSAVESRSTHKPSDTSLISLICDVQFCPWVLLCWQWICLFCQLNAALVFPWNQFTNCEKCVDHLLTVAGWINGNNTAKAFQVTRDVTCDSCAAFCTTRLLVCTASFFLEWVFKIRHFICSVFLWKSMCFIGHIYGGK